MNSEDQKNIRAVDDLFIKLSVSYLALPNLIFLLGWMRPAVGIPLSMLLLWGWWSVAFKVREGNPIRVKANTRTLWLVLAATVAWVALAGVGGIAPQSEDYAEHNFIFHDLAHEKWPVIYQTEEYGSTFFCYCVGYYLVPSSAAFWLGDAAIPAVSFAWTALGVGLFFYWLATFHKAGMKFLLIVLCYAGAGLAWLWVKRHGLPGLSHQENSSMATQLTELGLSHSYLDLPTKFFFTPQHALASTLTTALLYELVWLRKDVRGAGFVWAITLVWSLLTGLGLLIIPLASLWRVPLRNWFTLVNVVCGGALALVMVVFYKAHFPLEISGPIWKFPTLTAWPLLLPVFLAVQLLPVVFVALIDSKYKVLKNHRSLFMAGALVLMLLPFYRLGHESDLRLQVGTCASLLVAMAVALCFVSDAFSWRKPLFPMLAALYCFGAIYPVARPVLNIFTNKEDESYRHLHAEKGLQHLPDLNKDWSYSFQIQYLGRLDSPAYRWLLKQSADGTNSSAKSL